MHNLFFTGIYKSKALIFCKRALILAITFFLLSPAMANVEDEKMDEPGPKEKKAKAKKSWEIPSACNRCFRVYSGFTYLFYSQKPPKNLQEVEYKNFTAPSYLVEGVYRFLPGWRARLEYVSHSPAELKSNSVDFQNNQISWSYLGLGADWNFAKPFAFLGFAWVPRAYFAYQMHSLPYISEVNGVYTVSSEKVDTFSAGFHFDIGVRGKSYNYFWSGRMQTPVNSGGKLKWAGGGLGFEGAIGMAKKINESWSWNVFWGGQYHQYKYTVGDVSADYKIGNSQINIGLGYTN